MPKIRVSIRNEMLTVIRFRFRRVVSILIFLDLCLFYFTKNGCLHYQFKQTEQDCWKCADSHNCLGLVTSLWIGLSKQFVIEIVQTMQYRPSGTFMFRKKFECHIESGICQVAVNILRIPKEQYIYLQLYVAIFK